MADVASPELALIDPGLAERLRCSLPDPGDCLAPRLSVSPSGAPSAGVPSHDLVRYDHKWSPRRPSLVSLVASLVLALLFASLTLDLLPLPRSLPVLLEKSTGDANDRTRGAAMSQVPEKPHSQGSPAVVGNAKSANGAAKSAVQPPSLPQTKPETSPARLSESTRQGSVASPNEKASSSPSALEATTLQWPREPGATFYNLVLRRQGTRVLDLWPRSNRLSIPADRDVDGHVIAPGRYEWFVYAVFRSRGETTFSDLLKRGEIVVTR